MIKKLKTTIVIVLIIGLSNISNAQWSQVGNAISGESGDRSGYSISLSSDGSNVAIGALFNSENGSESGQVRIFTNSGGNWIQKGNNINGEAEDDRSGSAVSINSNGSVVAIGAPYNEEGAMYGGHVRIYEYVGGNWIQKGSDIDGNVGDKIGFSVSINSDGSIVAIGAPTSSVNGFDAGCVRIYEFSGSNWMQIGTDITGDNLNDLFGTSVSLNSEGFTVAIGATQSNNGDQGGYTKIYQYTGGNWVQMGDGFNGATSIDNLGTSVALNSNGLIVAIGAPQSFYTSTQAGYVRLYNYSDGNWTQMGNTIYGEASLDWFGYAVSLNFDGYTVSIGAPQNDGNDVNAGSVTTYTFIEGAWVQDGNTINGENNSSNAGYSVSLSTDGSIVAIGEPWDNGNSYQAGRVRVFTKPNAILESSSDLTVAIYPNPTTGEIIIEGVNLEMVEVITIEGQITEHIEIINDITKIDLSNQSKGIYFIKVIADKEMSVKKIVIE